MNEILFSNNSMPVVYAADCLTAQEPFFHCDRVADFHIMIYVTSGQISVCEQETDFHINKGEILFLKKGVHHFGKEQIKAGTSWYYVHFDIQSCAELPQYSISDNKKASCIYLPKKLENISNSSIERMITDFNETYNGTKPCWEINAKFFHLLSECAMSCIEKREYTISDKICLFLEEHISQPFSAKDIEQHFFLSYKYMSAVFRKEKNTTMQKYHNSLKMKQACRLLRTTQLSVGEISNSLGFSDMLYFSRCFHTTVGTSPTEYRKNAHYDY